MSLCLCVSVSSPPLDEGLDECGVALCCSQVKQGHATKRLGVDQMLGFGPAGSVHHLLTNHHHTTLKGASCLGLSNILALDGIVQGLKVCVKRIHEKTDAVG